MAGHVPRYSRGLMHRYPTNSGLKHRALLLLFLVLTVLPVMDSIQAQEDKAVPPAPSRIFPATPTTPVPPTAPDQPKVERPQPPPVATTPLPAPNGPSAAPPFPVPAVQPPIRRFQFKIAPDTPLKDLLPIPPSTKKSARHVGDDDLTQVPEVEFQAPLAKNLSNEEVMKQTAHMIAKINHLNAKKADHFIEELRKERLDLHGLPMAMGDACRTKGERSRQFALAVATARNALQLRQRVAVTTNAPPPAPQPLPPPGSPPAVPAPIQQQVVIEERIVELDRPFDSFWDQYQAACLQEDKKLAHVDRDLRGHVTVARIAALMQVLAPEAPSVRLGLVKYLSTVSHIEATKALARLAIFSAEDEIRQAAVDALKVRRERDYTEILLQGLRYPWPAVAHRAANALVKLERTDVLPQLVDVLDAPDPRAPETQEVDQKKVTVVRELVRINHHRNCLLCHAPGNTGNVSPDSLTAAVPVPTEPLPSPFDGYRNSSPDVLVRVDVTYLRQDFSAYQAVADANPWPEMQRFDFLVRERVLEEEEAAACREKFTKREPGRLSPYHRAALTALREMTGKDTEPTAVAWRRLLAQDGNQKN